MKEIKKVSWRSPSNIALVKYWGKHGNQLPSNPSISFTLDKCYSETSLAISENLAFRIKILSLFEKLAEDFPFLTKYALSIHSTNSFPHSSGIASSASSMSALALCLCELEAKLKTGKGATDKHKFLRKASHYARIGSGSASRSIYPIASLWGKADKVKGSSDEYAIPFDTEVHTSFRKFQNSILIASSAEKKVSSRVGHALMKTHPFAKSRFRQANANIAEMISALRTGDMEKFGLITETEAMTLHALMMCSTPNFILMNPSSLAMISKIKAFREATKLPVYFTLDAGPNIHLLYPENIKSKVIPFIQAELSEHCEDGRIIWDQIGKGPTAIK
jgi:diphosphomevalonate decarboxylase